MKKKIIGFGLMVASIGAFTGVALAATMNDGAMMHKDSTMPSSVMMMHSPAPMILNINSDGTGRLRGVVTSVTANSLTVAGWGGVWTIKTMPNTTMFPTGSSLSDIKVGDFVGAVGTVSEDAPTMTATTIRNWSPKNAMMHDSMMKKDKTMSTSSDSMMHR